MYSRSYTDTALSIPDGYSGTAFTEPKDPPPSEAEEVAVSAEEGRKSEESGVFSSLLSKLPLGGLLGKGVSLRLPHIGTEEILIIMAAAFLFLSEDGDKECALMLLLLLFI